MRKLTYDDASGFKIDDVQVTIKQLSEITEPVYGYRIIEPLTEAIFDGGPMLMPVLEAGLIRDLRVASMLYVDAIGTTELPSGDIEDLVWLVNKVGPEVLATTLRGMICVRYSQINGVPVSMRHINASIDTLLKIGGDLAYEIEQHDKKPWSISSDTGETEEDARGLPKLNVKRAIDNCTKIIVEAFGADALKALQPNISSMADAYKDITYLNLVSRYRTLKRDIRRMLEVKSETDGEARLFFEKAGIDGCHLAFFRNPNVEERVTRQSIQSKTAFTIVDFGSLDLEIAKRLAARNGFPRAWHEFTSVEQLARHAAKGIKSEERQRRLGHGIVRAYVCHENPMTLATKFYGFRQARGKYELVKQILQNAEPEKQDPWIADVKLRLAKNLLMPLAEVDKLGDIGQLATLVKRGDDPFTPISLERKNEIWNLLAEVCGDPELRARILERHPGADLHAMLFAESAATWNWRILAGCSRPTSGRWSLYGTLEDVMRETAWLCIKYGGKPMVYHGMELLIENIDKDLAFKAACEAQERVLGDVWYEPSARLSRAWK